MGILFYTQEVNKSFRANIYPCRRNHPKINNYFQVGIFRDQKVSTNLNIDHEYRLN